MYTLPFYVANTADMKLKGTLSWVHFAVKNENYGALRIFSEIVAAEEAVEPRGGGVRPIPFVPQKHINDLPALIDRVIQNRESS
jgi:hypothetical protein